MIADRTEDRLAELRRDVRRDAERHAVPSPAAGRPRRRRRQGLPSAFGRAILTLAIGGVLPFLVLLRAAVSFDARGAGVWTAVGGGALLAAGVIAVLAAWLSRLITGRARFVAVTKWVALPLVAVWCGYALFYFARVNAKTDAVRDSYTALHPILRVALSTVILADPDLVVTDAKRVPQDYGRMGLPVFDRTLHYRQSDGWVHAVDLRTNGRSVFKNRAVHFYFWAMGFGTLRHVGTDDHLHVELRNVTATGDASRPNRH